MTKYPSQYVFSYCNVFGETCEYIFASSFAFTGLIDFNEREYVKRIHYFRFNSPMPEGHFSETKSLVEMEDHLPRVTI